jgi:hypothetical protein
LRGNSGGRRRMAATAAESLGRSGRCRRWRSRRTSPAPSPPRASATSSRT